MFPVVIDIPYKLARKLLPNGIYSLASKIIGRKKIYCTFSTYQNIFDNYLYHLPELSGKTILEVGCGNQLHTSVQFLLHEAKQVLLAEPKLENSKHQFLSAIQPFSDQNISHEQIISFKDLDSIPGTFNRNIDIICSNFVLEHFSDLDNYFQNVNRLLTNDGVAYSYVDLSDHSLHPFDAISFLKWIYQKNTLNHLKYSNKLFSFLEDKRIFVNRVLLPAYIDYSKQYNFKYEITPRKVEKCPIHKDLTSGLKYQNEEDLFVSHFGMKLKRAEPE